MDIIQNAIKCSICCEILESPVILPCNDTICKKHVSNQSNDIIRCEKCGVEHRIPPNGFQSNRALQEIIKAQIGHLDLGTVHNSAKKACESFELALNELEVLLKDPYSYTHERITELKNDVQLKGEELKLIIDKTMKEHLDRLEEYERQSKEYLSSNEFKEESKKFENELKSAHSNLESWLESLNKVKLDEEKWKSIINKSWQKLKSIHNESERFKNKLLLNKFEENQKSVNFFKSIKIETTMELEFMPNKRCFLDSKIINQSSSQKLEELLEKKELNGRKWKLLYRGSRDGFGAYDFHSRCDGKPKTLTIVKSTLGNIFGGYTSLSWESYDGSWEYDASAFIMSIVNNENRPVIFEHITSGHFLVFSICLDFRRGPIFGGGSDFSIFDDSNTNMRSYSNVGRTFIHPDYPYGSENAKTILAGSESFQVQDIEVFQMHLIN